MEFDSEIGISSLIWLSSLRPADEGPSRRITDDLSASLRRSDFPFTSYAVESVALFVDALEKIAQSAHQGARPILHFDMHGSKENGLEIAATRESVPWPLVVRKLRAINIETKNNLCVVAASCFGLYAIKEITIGEPTPFYILIAPEKEVTLGFLEDHTVGFYEEVLASNDIREAYERHLAGGMTVFHCEKVLATALMKYVRDSCRGKGASERRESLLTEVFLSGREPSPENLRSARKQVKDGVRPNQALVDQYAERFLIGKRWAFTIEHLLELANGADKSPAL